MNDKAAVRTDGPRSPGPTVQEVLRSDANPPADIFLTECNVDMGSEDIPRERYFSRDWYELEKERMWKKVWQVACRVEELADPGDYYVYDICEKSVLLVRDNDNRIRAYVNSCLHRGQALCDGQGHKTEFRCPFHGFTWRLDGSLKYVPGQWDFDHLNVEEFGLPEVKVDTWGGFVFINLDKNCASLQEYLEILPQHLSGEHFENRYKAAHVSQVVPCNWKVVQEAFMEGYHVAETHFQKDENGHVSVDGRAAFGSDTTIQYDVWPDIRHIDRLIFNTGLASQYVIDKLPSEQHIVDLLLRQLPEEMRPKLSEGQQARALLADFFRKSLSELYRADMSGLSDMDALDQIQYSIFPNFTVWATPFAPLIYRFRPWNDSPDEALFEVWLLYPKPEDGSEVKPVPEKRIAPDDKWEDCAELGVYGPVVDEDIPNLPLLQKGLKASEKPGVTFANYQESRIRHHHQTLAEYVSRSD